MDSFSPKLPLPKYRAFEALRDQIIEYLLQQKPEIGERFPSVRELMAATSLSQKTVRRAMDQLDREGWIQRQVGVGTFVGPRVNIPVVPHRVRQRPVESWVRMGVLTIMDVERSWYRSPMLDGVEHAAADHHLGAELLISRQAELGRLHERMTRTPPEVMVSLGAADMTGFAIDLAGVLGIPCIVAGTRAADASLPMVREDNGQGIAAAVRHLVEQGHRRIGLVIEKAPFWHNFERRDAYLRGLRQSGIEPHEQLVHWTTLYSDADEDVAAMSAFLRRERPTAVVFATYSAARVCRPLVSSGALKIPRDLSVVVFDQAPRTADWLGVAVTHIAQPLREMGRTAAGMARTLADGGTVKQETLLPCRLVEGRSVAPLDDLGEDTGG